MAIFIPEIKHSLQRVNLLFFLIKEKYQTKIKLLTYLKLD